MIQHLLKRKKLFHVGDFFIKTKLNKSELDDLFNNYSQSQQLSTNMNAFATWLVEKKHAKFVNIARYKR